jgi:hypothetical protein
LWKKCYTVFFFFFFLKLPYLAIGSRGSTTCEFFYFSVCFLLYNQIWLNPLVHDCHFWCNIRKFGKTCWWYWYGRLVCLGGGLKGSGNFSVYLFEMPNVVRQQLPVRYRPGFQKGKTKLRSTQSMGVIILRKPMVVGWGHGLYWLLPTKARILCLDFIIECIVA